MNSLTHQPFTDAEFRKLQGPSFEGGRISFVELGGLDRPIRTDADLLSILECTSRNDALLIPRRLISQEFMTAALREAEIRVPRHPDNDFRRWNLTGGGMITNSVPHCHREHACLVMPEPTPITSAYFNTASVLREARRSAGDKSLPLWFRSILNDIYSGGSTSQLEKVEGPIREKLELVQEFQSRINASGGMFKADLGSDGYGIVTFPITTLHGRSLLKDLERREPTIWRSFRAPDAADTSLSLADE